MRAVLAIGLGALALGACSTNTKGSWSCEAPIGGTACASIESIDRNGPAAASAAANSPGIETARPVRWWEPQPFVFSAEAGPRREGDQVMMVVFAPWVDAQGDYHGRSEVHAVMRRGGWWVATPPAAQPAQSQR
jgi:conjugal transfer pilus assembly protein TraV